MPTHRTLILDDDPRICRLLERLVETVGHDVRSVETAAGFRALFHDFRPHTVIVDLQLSDDSEDGVTLLRFLAELNSPARVVLVSGVESRILAATAELGRSMGLIMVEPVAKPVDAVALRSRLDTRVDAPRAPRAPARALISAELLATAIGAGELVVFYQPIVALGAQRLFGVEALVRWSHPQLGLVAPDEFIPLAEDCGLIADVTSDVLLKAVRDVASWRESRPGLRVSVNLSQSLLGDLTIPEQILGLLHRFEVPSDRFVLEVTERSPTSRFASAMDVLTRLRLRGVSVALDDFGTGFSSLEQMYRLPYDTLKIDRSFVRDMFARDSARAIVESTIQLANRLGLSVVAEGIEDRATSEALAKMGCPLGQGFLFGKPMSSADFVTWARRWDRGGAVRLGTARVRGKRAAGNRKAVPPGGCGPPGYDFDSVP